MIKKKRSKQEKFDYTDFEKEAVSKLRSGKGLTGKDGALTGMISRILTLAMDQEMTEHLAGKQEGNRRNGHTSKKVRTGLGEIPLAPPRDREGTFQPKMIPKWGRTLAPEIEQQIMTLYAIGNSYEDIRTHLQEMYGVDYSPRLLSNLTDQVFEEIRVWKSRALSSVYVTIYLDAIHYKVREDRRVITKAVYTVFGVTCDGEREVLGIHIGAAEGARHWARILEGIKDRGVEDVLFFCVDGLKGFSDAIAAVFPLSIVQRCIVHMVRTSLKFVSYKDYREVCKDLKKVYQADEMEGALEELERFEMKWLEKYPEVAEKWRKDWKELSPFFDYPEAIRRSIYTTNPVEALHRCMRKATKSKGAFVSDAALEKQLYLTLRYNKKKWNRKIRNWPDMARAYRTEFPDRFRPEE
jgi:transposase-like protein